MFGLSSPEDIIYQRCMYNMYALRSDNKLSVYIMMSQMTKTKNKIKINKLPTKSNVTLNNHEQKLDWNRKNFHIKWSGFEQSRKKGELNLTNL